MWYVLIIYYCVIFLYNIFIKDYNSEIEALADTVIPVIAILICSILGLIF